MFLATLGRELVHVCSMCMLLNVNQHSNGSVMGHLRSG